MNQHAVGAGPGVTVVLSVILDTVTSVFPAVCPSFMHRIILRPYRAMENTLRK